MCDVIKGILMAKKYQYRVKNVSQLGASLQWHEHNRAVHMLHQAMVSVCNCGNSLDDHGKARGALATHIYFFQGFKSSKDDQTSL